MLGYDADAVYRAILDLRARGGEGVLVTVVEREGSAPAEPGTKMLVGPGGHLVGTVGGGRLEALAVARAQEALRRREGALQRYTLTERGDPDDEGAPTGMLCGGRVALFYEYLGSPLRAYVYGAGHVGAALARVLRLLHAHVVVIDPRADLAALAEGADRTVVAPYATALDGEDVPVGGYFVIATPGHESDYDVLARVLTSSWAPRYVGMVASGRKAAGLVGRLREEHGADIDLGPLYTPVGLDLGGSTPEEIALSIAAEIQAVRYCKAGHRHLRAP